MNENEEKYNELYGEAIDLTSCLELLREKSAVAKIDANGECVIVPTSLKEEVALMLAKRLQEVERQMDEMCKSK